METKPALLDNKPIELHTHTHRRVVAVRVRIVPWRVEGREGVWGGVGVWRIGGVWGGVCGG